jgi:type I restriction enzyme M protein
VPCQLWFFDRAKERDETRREQVLMLDAHNIYRKVSRAIYDFSPEQQQNIAAIVWLYRGQGERFLKLVESYIDQAVSRGAAAGTPLDAFTQGLDKLAGLVEPFAVTERNPDALAETWKELATLRGTLAVDVAAFAAEVTTRASDWEKTARDNPGLTAARQSLHPAAEQCRDLTKAIDLSAKLAGRAIDIAVKDLDARDSDTWPNADITRARKTLETRAPTRSRRCTRCATS